MPKLEKTERDWQRELTAEEYRITRLKGTEPAFSGMYWNCHVQGLYRCKCCNKVLFRSDDKYDSGCGWPSFMRPVRDDDIEEHRDLSYGMIRTEITCHHCGAHLGHVFPDGPAPTGLRYCVNSASLRLEPTQDLPEEQNLP